MRSRLLFALVAAAALPALAQERFIMGGFQVGLASFTSDTASDRLTGSGLEVDYGAKRMMNNATGFNIGGHVTFNLKRGHMMRVRAEETIATGEDDSLGLKLKSTLAQISVMGDYLFHVNGTNRGFYLTGGAGFEAVGLKLENSYYGEDTDARLALAYCAGLGVQISPRVGLELRYTGSKVDGLKYDQFNLPVRLNLTGDRVTFAVNVSF